MHHVYYDMLPGQEVPDELYWVEIGGDARIPPYGIHKKIQQKNADLVTNVTNDEGGLKRAVFVENGEYRVFVQERERADYGYELRPEEKVSENELRAIRLKHKAITEPTNTSESAAWSIVDSGEPKAVLHALRAIYFIKRADPDTQPEEIKELQNLHEEHIEEVDSFNTSSIINGKTGEVVPID